MPLHVFSPIWQLTKKMDDANALFPALLETIGENLDEMRAAFYYAQRNQTKDQCNRDMAENKGVLIGKITVPSERHPTKREPFYTVLDKTNRTGYLIPCEVTSHLAPSISRQKDGTYIFCHYKWRKTTDTPAWTEQDPGQWGELTTTQLTDWAEDRALDSYLTASVVWKEWSTILYGVSGGVPMDDDIRFSWRPFYLENVKTNDRLLTDCFIFHNTKLGKPLEGA